MKFIVFVIVALIFGGCSENNFERSEIFMGTVVNLKATGRNADIAVNESFNRVAEIENVIAVDIKNLEDAAGNMFVEVSPEVYEILTTAQKYSELTNGAFDITIGAASELWNDARENKLLPTDTEIARVKNLAGYEHLQLQNQSARLDIAGMKIDLGGIAKGYAVDEVRKIFNKYKISDGIIDFGTSTIFAVGEKNIGVKNPRVENSLAQIVTIKDSAISTSGDYIKYFDVAGRRYHHIINPKTCTPSDSGIKSVSVIINGDIEHCGMLADIFSTTIFIVGEDVARKFLPQNYSPIVIR